MTGVLSGGLLVVAALIVAAPAASSRTRLARLSSARTRPGPALPDLLRALEKLPAKWTVTLAGGAGGVFGLLWYGPVAGVIAGGYAGLAVQILLRRRHVKTTHQALVDAMDGLASLVADLRAGLPPTVALNAALPRLIGAAAHRPGSASVADLAPHLDHSARGRMLARLTAAWHTADLTGAPLADVLERLETEVRSGERARVLAAAHAASAQVTAILLAALPAAGVVLGYGMGADPLAFLFQSLPGGVCAVAALALQLAGLAWTRVLSRVDPSQVDPQPVGGLL